MRTTLLWLVNRFFARSAMLQILGYLNKHFSLLESIFINYPADQDFCDSYTSPTQAEKITWTPYFTGVFRYSGRWSLALSISSTNKELLQRTNRDSLIAFTRRVNDLANVLQIRHVTHAGILPSVLQRFGLRTESPESDVTAKIVLNAIDKLMLKHPEVHNLFILGSRGHVGARVDRLIRARMPFDFRLVCLDLKGRMDWPNDLEGSSMVVNIASPHAIVRFIDNMAPGDILLNEVYPAPDRKIRAELVKKGATAFHLVGVEGQAFPSFPREYAGGIPCCAAWTSEGGQVILRRIT